MMRSQSPLTVTLLALIVSAAGCRTPLATVARAATGQLHPAATPTKAPEQVASQPARTIPAGVEPLPDPTREQALAQILDDLQRLGAENPAAQQALLEQLHTSEPAHWPLLVQRMRADVGYHRQLAARESRGNVMPASAQQENAAPHGPAGYTAPNATPHAWPSTPDPGPASPAAGPRADGGPLYDGAVEAASGRGGYPTTHAPEPIARLTPPDDPPAPPAHQVERTWQATLDEAIELLAAQAHERPHSTDEAYDHVRLRLLQLAAGDLDAAAAPAPGLSTTEQEYWTNQLFTLGTLLDHGAQPEARRRAAAAGIHLQHATAALEQLGSLTVHNLAFCEEIYGFGAYKPFEAPKFRSGQEVALYAEVENFHTETTERGEHTSLATSYRVLDQRGARVDSGEFPVVDDHCLRRRRDFHIQYGITLPRAIYPGQYVLELTITDQLGDKIGHGSIGFEIVREPGT